MSGSPPKPPGWLRWSVAISVGHVGRRVDRQPILARQQPRVVIDRAVLADPVPHRKRHAEEPLPADAPVAVEAVDPVLEPRLHVGGVPAQLGAALQQPLAELHRLHEPLAAGDDLERAVPLLVELHGMRDRPRLGGQVAALAQLLHDPHARLRRRQARELVVAGLGTRGIVALPPRLTPRQRAQRAVCLDDRADREPELAPPDHVGDIAERADHRDARALLRIGQVVRLHRHAGAEERRHDVPIEQRLVPLVVRMRDQRDAGGNQLGTRRLDLDEAVAVSLGEADAVIRARLLAVLELGLRHGGPEVDVPECRRLELIGVAALQQPQERELRDALRPAVDGRVGHRPVDRQAEMPPQVLEDLLVLGRELDAQLDEVRPRHRHRAACRASPAARTTGRTAARDRTAPRSSSGPGARWAGRCRPTPSGRRRPGRASAGSAP